MKVYLIRHGKTRGNQEHRYVGATDEDLLPEAEKALGLRKQEIKEKAGEGFLQAETVYVSPLKRCRQTASVLFPDKEQVVAEGLRECDFGEYEYKNYQELCGYPAYQEFIDSNGESGFPGGETLKTFQDRCVMTFDEIVGKKLQEEDSGQSIVLVVHGGTIMAILDKYARPHKSYYEWQSENGACFEAVVVQEEEGFYLGDVRKV
ncbi:MAG: histidine phosphatase family protein [Lachnospiraceae bacterium]|nr:histidine phosphatase family protein [Lachnospiraceae bacterium]